MKITLEWIAYLLYTVSSKAYIELNIILIITLLLKKIFKGMKSYWYWEWQLVMLLITFKFNLSIDLMHLKIIFYCLDALILSKSYNELIGMH